MESRPLFSSVSTPSSRRNGPLGYTYIWPCLPQRCMSDNGLGNIDFNPEGVSATPDEAVDLFHDPDLAYYAIQSAAAIDDDLDIEIDEDVAVEEVVIREKVNVFQLVMQYTEAFGIYFLSYLKGREELLTDLIDTDPRDVKRFFESLDAGTENAFLDDEGIDEDYREVLEYWFGYRFIDSDGEQEDVHEAIDWEEFSVDTVDDLVQQSIDVLQSDLRQIAAFYLRFGDVYNAVKHGDRVIIGAESEISVEAEGEVLDRFDETDFVGFICKDDNEPFLVTLPVEHLFDDALIIAGKVRRLFNYSKEVSEALIQEDAAEAGLSITFLERNDDGGDDGNEWAKGSTDGGVMIVPKTDELQRLIADRPTGTFACRLEVDGDTLVVRTVRDDERSAEYPVKITAQHEGAVGLSSQWQMGTTFTFDPSEIDVVQYAELLDLKRQQQEETVDSVRIVDEDLDLTFESEGFTGLNGEQVPTFVDEEYVAFLALAQEITQQRIPTPLHLSEEQEEVLDEAVERNTSNMSREEVVDIISRLEELGQDRVFTAIWVELVTPEQDLLTREQVLQFPDSLSFEATVDNPEDYPEIDGDTIEIEAGVDCQIQGTLRGRPVSFPVLIRQLDADPDSLYDIFAFLDEQREAQTDSLRPTLYVEYDTNEHGFWNTENLVRLQVVHWERCPLCHEFLSTTPEQHLRGLC